MKDFGQTIPGHGGVTDRFDCQMIMAMFAYVYFWNYVASTEFAVGEALDVSAWCWLSSCSKCRLTQLNVWSASAFQRLPMGSVAWGSGCVVDAVMFDSRGISEGRSAGHRAGQQARMQQQTQGAHTAHASCFLGCISDCAAAAVTYKHHLCLLCWAVQVALKLYPHQQLELWARLGNVLLVDGLLPSSLEPSIQTAFAMVNATSTVRSTPYWS
jgi:hypothetical protein